MSKDTDPSRFGISRRTRGLLAVGALGTAAVLALPGCSAVPESTPIVKRSPDLSALTKEPPKAVMDKLSTAVQIQVGYKGEGIQVFSATKTAFDNDTSFDSYVSGGQILRDFRARQIALDPCYISISGSPVPEKTVTHRSSFNGKDTVPNVSVLAADNKTAIEGVFVSDTIPQIEDEVNLLYYNGGKAEPTAIHGVIGAYKERKKTQKAYSDYSDMAVLTRDPLRTDAIGGNVLNDEAKTVGIITEVDSKPYTIPEARNKLHADFVGRQTDKDVYITYISPTNKSQINTLTQKKATLAC